MSERWPADKVERWPIDRLLPAARNARVHSAEQVARIVASMREWGWSEEPDAGNLHVRVCGGRGWQQIVYASPAQGGAQTALAHCARAAGRRATIFVAKRAAPHARTLAAKRLGATVVQVSPGYLSVVQARARAYAAARGAFLLPFGADMPAAIEAIRRAAAALDEAPDEVWCAAGSGVLMRGLAAAWPAARHIAVQVGRHLRPDEVSGAEIMVYPRPFAAPAASAPPFPSDPHYDAKAWEMLAARHGPGRVLFWNVAGPAD